MQGYPTHWAAWVMAGSGPGGSFVAEILIVDDDGDSVELLMDMLDDTHQVTGTTDSVKALELIETRRFDLLITDVRMPAHNGFTLIRMAKKLKPDLAVIVISAYYSKTDPTCCSIVDSFASVALQKPFTIPGVRAAIEKALRPAGVDLSREPASDRAAGGPAA